MNPGSIQTDLAQAASQLRQIAKLLETTQSAVGLLGERIQHGLDAAAPNPDGSPTYCVPVEVLDALSAAVTNVGGAA